MADSIYSLGLKILELSKKVLSLSEKLNLKQDLLSLDNSPALGSPNPVSSTGIFQSYLDMIYPVGTVYISTNSTSPSTFLGGTWTRIQDTFLLAAGSTYTAGDTGGNATHSHTTNAGTTGGTAITVDQMPSHTHQVKLYTIAGDIAQSWGTIDNVNQKAEWDSGPVKATGGGQAHTHTQVSVGTDSQSNMPPYLAVYVWERTA